jgi:GAF domain-containing protein
MPQQHAFEGVVASMAAFVVGRQPLDQTLTRVAEFARDAVGADYAAVTTVRDGRAETTAATDPMILLIDQAQYDADTGPCLDAYRTGEPTRMGATEDDDRWRHFGRSAADHGVHSTLSLPLLLDGDGIGALNLYSRHHDAFSDDDHAMGARFAVPAAALVTNALLFWEARGSADSLETALTSRAVIDQAKGILMGQQRIDADAAFDILRRASQRENVKLREIAERLVETASHPRPAATCTADAAGEP